MNVDIISSIMYNADNSLSFIVTPNLRKAAAIVFMSLLWQNESRSINVIGPDSVLRATKAA